MDTATKSTLHLLPDWKRRILEDHEYESKTVNGNVWPVKLLRNEGRRAVWNMSALMGVSAHGVPGQACRALELYLARHTRETLPTIPGTEEWEEFKRGLVSRLPLLIATCVQLAAKMSNAGVHMNPNLVRTCLICRGIYVPLDDIIAAEYHVFSTLGFRMPLWTSVDIAQLLALEAGLSKTMLDGVALVVDITECCRDRLNNHVLVLAGLSPEIAAVHRSRVRTLHLCAGAVLASVRYLSYTGRDPATLLARLTRAPLSYLSCLRDVILAHILIDDLPDLIPRTHKRKRSVSLSPEY